jgi:hypothetical protein
MSSSPDLPTATEAIKPTRRGRGKIARLPRKIREQVNVMLGDGLPHAEIITRLGEHGKDLNRQNLINWQAGGYREWLKDQPWLDQLHSTVDFAVNVLDDSDSPKIREASLIIAIKQMYELIRSFEPAEFKAQLTAEPTTYSRILNSLAKLAEVGLRYDRERGEVTRVFARETSRSKKAAGLTEDLLHQYENEFKLIRRPNKTNRPQTVSSDVSLSKANEPADTTNEQLSKPE